MFKTKYINTYVCLSPLPSEVDTNGDEDGDRASDGDGVPALTIMEDS